MTDDLEDLVGPIGTAQPTDTPALEPTAADFMRPQTADWLARVFRMAPQTAAKRLADCPVKDWRKGARGGQPKPVYDFVEASAYLVKPRVDLVKYLSSLNSNNIPPHINKTFWDAMNARAKWEANARRTWHDEDVLKVLGETALKIREVTLLWVDQLPDKASLTQENHVALRNAANDLLEQIKIGLQDLPRQRRTESVVASLDRHLEGEVNLNDSDFLIGDYDEA